MADPTTCTEFASMGVAILMTGIAVAGRALIDSVDMTTRASHRGVFSGQFEGGQVVVEGGWFPGGGCVAGSAACTVPTSMGVAILMTGIAVVWSALVEAVDMATRASHRGVFTGQFEGGQVVIEGGWFPTVYGMAGTTSRAKVAVVIVVLLVAGIAVAGSAMVDMVDMATRTGGCGVFACQFEKG